jgi:hypothetical protein
MNATPEFSSSQPMIKGICRFSHVSPAVFIFSPTGVVHVIAEVGRYENIIGDIARGHVVRERRKRFVVSRAIFIVRIRWRTGNSGNTVLCRRVFTN